MAKSKEELYGMATDTLAKILEGGQKYTIGSRSLERIDFDKLRTFQKELAEEMAEGESGGLFANTYVAVFEPR